MTKPTEWQCAQRRLRSVWASAQSDQSLRCALLMGPKLSSCGQQRLWSDWADAQADLKIRWAHSHFVGFVMSRLTRSTIDWSQSLDWSQSQAQSLESDYGRGNNFIRCFIWLNIIMQYNWASSWENLFLPYAKNKGADQPAHPRSLINTFVVRCLDSILSLVSISEIARLMPVWV